MWRVLWVLMLTCFGCATTGSTEQKQSFEGYSPYNSHFWCGESCTVAAGCEEGLICGCVKIQAGGKDLMMPDEAKKELVDRALEELAKGLMPITAKDLLSSHHVIKEIRGSFPNTRFLCGVFPKYAQFGKYPEATVKSGEVVTATVIRTPIDKEEMQRWRGIGHISTRERDFVSHTYSIVEGGNRVEMVCRFRPGCDNFHLPPDAGTEQDEACVDISTCRFCEKERNWPDGSSVAWAKECLTTGKQTMTITASSQPPTSKEVEEPDF